MFSVLVCIAGAVVAEAGIPQRPNAGLRFYQPASSQPVRPVLIRSQIANPIGTSSLFNSYIPEFTRTFFSPLVFDTVSSYVPLHSLSNTLKLNQAPISHVAIGPTSTIAHISPPTVLNSEFNRPTLSNPILNIPVLNSASISQDVKRPATITHLPQSPSVLSPAPINHAVIKPGITNTQEPLNPLIKNDVQKIQEEKSVSYSISEQDYELLKLHKTEGQDSPYTPIPGLDTASLGEKHQNTHNEHGKGKDASHKSSDSYNVLKRSAVPNHAYQGYAEPSFANPSEPVVIKHIYLHVPHPDFEEPRPAPVNLPPPKKTYNILFIKAPDQEQQNHAYLQPLLQSQQPQIEDKTLIYVLSKKQDPVQAVFPTQQTPLSPEVFFVKYQTKSGDITDIRKKLDEESFIESSLVERKRSVKDSPIDSHLENKLLDKVHQK